MSQPPTRSRIRATFEVVGSFDPHDFTKTTGLRATRIWRAGTPVGLLACKDDGWELSTEYESGWNLTAHVERVVSLVEPHRSLIRSYVRARSLRAFVFAVSILEDVTPSLLLTPALLRSIADLDATFEFDQCAPRETDDGEGH